MKFITTLLCLSLLIMAMLETVTLHRATVCRQKAYLKGVELLTRSTLPSATVSEQSVELSCKLLLTRTNSLIQWRTLPNLKTHHLVVSLKGKL